MTGHQQAATDLISCHTNVTLLQAHGLLAPAVQQGILGATARDGLCQVRAALSLNKQIIMFPAHTFLQLSGFDTNMLQLG